MNAVKVVLFDLDDTLFDHEHCSRSGLEAIHREIPQYGRKPLPSLCGEYERLLNELHARVLTGEMTTEEARIERFHRLNLWCGAASPELTGAAVATRYREVYQLSRRPVPGALELLRALKPRVKVGIVTNNVTRKQKEKLLHCALHDWVDFMVTSEEVGTPKPDPVIFQAALQRANAAPEEAVMVGDSWDADVHGAVGAGIRAVWLNRDGLPCPDSALAVEMTGLQDTGMVLAALLNP